MSIYKKPYLTFEHQLELLKSRGLAVTDDKIALEYLRRLGYYRLSGYWYPYRKSVCDVMYFGALYEYYLSAIHLANAPSQVDTFFAKIRLYEHSRHGLFNRMGTTFILEKLNCFRRTLASK